MNEIRRHLMIQLFEKYSLNIISDSEYVGKSFYCVCKLNEDQVFGTWSILSGSQYASINANGKVTINEGVTNQNIVIQCSYQGDTIEKTITISYDNQLTVEAPSEITGESTNLVARYNSTVVNASWELLSGSSYASLTSAGVLTILDTGYISVRATYTTYSDTKQIKVIYVAGTTTNVEVNDDGSVTTETVISTTDPETGSIVEEVTSQTVNEDGSVSNTTGTTITNQDGSYTSESTTINQDGSSATIEATGNADGSSESHKVEYNADGDPTAAENVLVDTTGNVNTQDIEYDDNGDPVVTGYSIDTTASEGEGKEFDGTGINTEFVPFDDSGNGFICHLYFSTAKENQPRPPIVEDTEDTGTNYLYNIMSAKSATQINGGWPGFDIRWTLKKTDGSIPSGTGIQFGYTQTGGTSTTRANMTGKSADGTTSGTYYDVTVTYDPNLYLPGNTYKFKVTSANGCMSTIQNNKTFDTNNIDFTIGYASNMQGQPYRHSDVTIYDFTITKIPVPDITPNDPVISCDGQHVSISCSTSGASVYYKLGDNGTFTLYSSQISINEDVTVYAYATFNKRTSNTVSQNCVYDDGLEVPVISFNGTHITITCPTPGATIWYKLNDALSYTQYSSAIHIDNDATVYAYASYNNKNSETVSQNCVYNSGISAPTINCDGHYVTIACSTSGVTIWYKLGNGEYSQYSSPIEISVTTEVSAYATLNGEHSSTTTRSCIYISGTTSPVITCENNTVTITCSTQGATIYYREGLSGSFTEYTVPFGINETISIFAYASLDDHDSQTVNETCVYIPPIVPAHDYSQDYLTFKVIDGGTINWKALGSNSTKTIDYQKNDETTWTSITSTSAGVTISVVAGDEVRFRGSNTTYCASSKSNYSGFEGGTATYNIEGNIMSLTAGDNFANVTTLPASWCFCSIFKKSNVVSAENLILPALTLTQCCYRAMFSYASLLQKAPALPATTLAIDCYWYMFEYTSIEVAPVLAATTLLKESYGYMFNHCSNLVYIKCLATSLSAQNCLQGWVTSVAASGTFVKADGVTWTTNSTSGIPSGWTAYDESNEPGEPEPDWDISDAPLLRTWHYSGNEIELPYSVNAIDSHSSSYFKGTANFTSDIILDTIQPTYLWFQHADQTADIYINDVKVETHWGGYNAFFSDITNYISVGKNDLKVVLNNTNRNTIAPNAGDFNFSNTLGEVKLWTSPVLPDVSYGYDGFHISTVWNQDHTNVTYTVKTSVPADLPNDATVILTVSDSKSGGHYYYTDTITDVGDITFNHTESVSNLTLWHGTTNPYLYEFKVEVFYNNIKYHTFTRSYGFRYYDYVIDESGIIQNETYTGFLLNGQPYYLRGVCMHCDIDGKANALTQSDFALDKSVLQDLGCNFVRLAHYPHPKEVYDYCDELGIIVQTEVPCVNKFQSTLPQDYYDHLVIQYNDMVNQHYNHPCIMFWGLGNEITTDDTSFAKTQLEAYRTQIKALDAERWVGYVLSHSYSNPSSAMGNPTMDWFGGNIYVGWYISKDSNDPTTEVNKRITNIITNLHKPYAFSEYGCGGVQRCHSDDPQTTTTKGNYARHDIEYQMWLHEGHIAAIKNLPQLLFTGEWQLFDVAVSSRNEGYTVCLDGETTSTDDSLRYLNDKGLLERDHTTKKDTYYLYKAWWNPTNKFVHICGKNYTKTADRSIKCYTNETGNLTMYINGASTETVPITNNIATFTATTFPANAVVRVVGATTEDSFTF